MAHLKKYGCAKTNTAGLFRHQHRDIKFTLIVDDFGIKYTKKEDVDHLIATIRTKYPIKLDMEPKQYIGIHLNFDYEKQKLVCLMGDYAKNKCFTGIGTSHPKTTFSLTGTLHTTKLQTNCTICTT